VSRRISFRGWVWITIMALYVLALAALAAVIMGLVTPAQATPFAPENARNGVLTVTNAPGGSVAAYRADIAASLAAGHRIIVRRDCTSVCAMVLEHPEAIRSGQIDISQAVFHVHQVSFPGGDKNTLQTHWYLAMFPREALDAAGVPDADRIGPEFYHIRGADVLRAMEGGAS
jgi:hypothetical protein